MSVGDPLVSLANGFAKPKQGSRGIEKDGLDFLVDELCKANAAAVQMLDARDQVPFVGLSA